MEFSSSEEEEMYQKTEEEHACMKALAMSVMSNGCGNGEACWLTSKTKKDQKEVQT